MRKPDLTTDPTLPKVTLILGGVERHPIYNYNAIVQAEAATGVNLLTAIVSDLSATKLRGLLWAALLPESPDIKIEEVGQLITPFNVETIHSALILAWFGSMSDPDDNPKEPKPGKPRARRRAKP